MRMILFCHKKVFFIRMVRRPLPLLPHIDFRANNIMSLYFCIYKYATLMSLHLIADI